MESGNENLIQAMSILSLTNICFKKCVMKSRGSGSEQPVNKEALLPMVGLNANLEGEWLLSEKETVCMHNCGKSYIELKDFLHEQFLKDYLFVRKKNRKTFENL